MSRKLGATQIELLHCLVRNGSYPGGWLWGTPSNTERILDSLVKRGLVERDTVTSKTWSGRPYTYTRWRLKPGVEIPPRETE